MFTISIFSWDDTDISVDGLRIGDSKSKVLKKWGEPYDIHEKSDTYRYRVLESEINGEYLQEVLILMKIIK